MHNRAGCTRNVRGSHLRDDALLELAHQPPLRHRHIQRGAAHANHAERDLRHSAAGRRAVTRSESMPDGTSGGVVRRPIIAAATAGVTLH